MNNRILIFGFLLTLAFSACRKNIDDIVEDTIVPDPEVIRYENGDVFGLVVDENEQPVGNAEVRLGNDFTLTDSLGIFYFDDQLLRSDRTYMEVSKSGFFPGSRTITPVPDAVNRVKIQLLQRNFSGEVSGASPGTIDLPGGAIQFPEGAFVDSVGNSFTGLVYVYARRLTPQTNGFEYQMPGDLRGLDLEGEIESLSTFGMLALELETQSGQTIQLAPDKKATITFPLSSDLLSAAPEIIPLWFFDQEEGLWVEAGSAQLEGDQYVGEVSHFTYWNADLPGRLIYLNGQVVSESGLALPGIHISFYLNEVAGTSHGLTAENGFFTAPVTAGEILTMTVEDACGELILETEVGPFIDNDNLGQIAISDQLVAQISGNVIDCNGLPVADGYVLYNSSFYSAFKVEDGSFNFAYPYCDETDFNLSAVDFSTALRSDPAFYSFEQNVDAGTLIACGTLQDPPYISLMVNDQSYFWINDSLQNVLGEIDLAKEVDGPPFGLSAPSTQLIGGFTDLSGGVMLDFELVFPAQTTANDLTEAYLAINTNAPIVGPFNFSNVYPFEDLDILEYETSGGITRGYFEVTVPSGPEVPVELTITCSFAVFLQ